MTEWVFLRGLTREAAHWGHFPDVFRSAVPDSRVHLIDLPGNGALHLDSSPATVAGLVAACQAERLRRGITSPVHLLAMSLGAMVAAEWARAAPAEVAGCVLINTSLRPFSPFYHRLLLANVPTLWRLAVGRGDALAPERTVFDLTCNHPDPTGDTLARWVDARRQRPVSAANALRQLLAAARYRAPQDAPPVPTLLLGSAHDRLVSHRCSQAIAHAWACPLQVHPSAGHDLPQDDPTWVAHAVSRWLAKLAG